MRSAEEKMLDEIEDAIAEGEPEDEGGVLKEFEEEDPEDMAPRRFLRFKVLHVLDMGRKGSAIPRLLNTELEDAIVDTLNAERRDICSKIHEDPWEPDPNRLQAAYHHGGQAGLMAEAAYQARMHFASMVRGLQEDYGPINGSCNVAKGQGANGMNRVVHDRNRRRR